MDKETQNIKRCEQIKEYLEKRTGIDDIGVTTRKRYIVDLRKFYSYLCHRYTDAPLRIIGNTLREGYGHDTILYNVKEFNKLDEIKQLECQSIVDECEKDIKALKKEYDEKLIDIKKLKPITSREANFIDTCMNIIYKSHRIILKKMNEINSLKERNREMEKIIYDNIENILLKK